MTNEQYICICFPVVSFLLFLCLPFVNTGPYLIRLLAKVIYYGSTPLGILLAGYVVNGKAPIWRVMTVIGGSSSNESQW